MLTRRKASQPKELSRDTIADWERTWPELYALNSETLDKPRGFEILKTRCVAIVGDEKKFRKICPKWKACVLWLTGITVEYDHGSKAYRFIEVQTHLTTRHERVLELHERKHRLETLRLGLMRDNDMATDHQRRLRILLMNQHADLAGKLESQREMARIALKSPETLPRVIGQQPAV